MNERKIVALADDQLVTLTVGREILSGSYEVYTVPSGRKLIELLGTVRPDMILLDIEMPELDGYETIKILKANPETADIPVIFLTARNDEVSELEGLSLGAIDYIYKPFSPPLLLKRIEVHLLIERQKRELKRYNDNLEELVKDKTRTIVELQNAVMATVSELIEYRGDVTDGHIERTQRFLEILIKGMIANGLYSGETGGWDVGQVVQAAQLHDVGKIAINERILQKPEKLTEEEFEQIKKHTLFGETVIESIQKKTAESEFLSYAKVLSLYHHERWNGEGYPYGLKGEDIPLLARLMSIVDVYDALISERPYKQPYTHEEAVDIIKEGSGVQFEPALVDLFLSVKDELSAAYSPAR
ncbi:MAG: response regulator [Oscillospiraceae bacterium]|nr:response regulator [Oscillospiraceae bacterium]